MVDSKENDKFDLQVKGLTINDLDLVFESQGSISPGLKLSEVIVCCVLGHDTHSASLYPWVEMGTGELSGKANEKPEGCLDELAFHA